MIGVEFRLGWTLRTAERVCRSVIDAGFVGASQAGAVNWWQTHPRAPPGSSSSRWVEASGLTKRTRMSTCQPQ